ncbi:MAG: AMP-binding protein [Burkholderiaceae bacterium]
MSLHLLLSELSQLGVKLKLLDDQQLSISAPKGSLTDSVMGRLKDNKAELIEWLTDNKSVAVMEALPVIDPDFENLYKLFPAADLQTAFLMGDSEDMEFHVRPHYYLEKELDGLDVARYEQALNAALYRQRANLIVATEDLRVRTLPTFTPVQVTVQDLRGLPEAETEAALLATRAQMSRQILPVDHWPWMDCRISLYGEKNGGYKARLHFNNNNIFSDGYGSLKLMADAMHYYHHPDQPLPELTLSFRDCVLALEKLEESPLGLASQQYWLDRLPQLPGPPPVPMRVGANPRSRSMLQRRELVLPEKTWSGFKDKARHYGLTPTNALYAVYAEVISCWSGSRHFLLNNMVTHRFPMHPEVKEIIGNFASLYPLEVDWRVSEPFYLRARKLQERIMTDLQHVYWSGVKVLQALNQVQKTPGRASIPFVVGSGLFMHPQEEPYFGCLETPQVMLDHQFWELADGRFWYVWDLIEHFFPEGMIDTMWEAYQTLLTRFAEDEDIWSTIEFDLLPAEQLQQRVELNRTASTVPEGVLRDALVLQAALHPDKAAVITPSRTLTYGELYLQAKAVAYRLLQAGAEPRELVAVMLDKGCEQVVAVHGTLIAGVAYVPIDPEWPQDRIHYLLGNIKAKRVLTRQGLLATMTLPEGVEALCIDCSNPELAIQTAARAPSTPQDLAYIIFTSGSTGMPKGVMIDHRGALNTVIDINRRFDVTRRDVVFGISSLYFDLSVYDLFGTAAAGGTLVLPDASGTTSPEAWIDAIRTQQVTVWNSVPALMQLLVDAAQAGDIT